MLDLEYLDGDDEPQNLIAWMCGPGLFISVCFTDCTCAVLRLIGCYLDVFMIVTYQI